jgi:hypothetical protein
MLEVQRESRKIWLKMLLLVHCPTNSHIGSLFVLGETFASYFVRERKGFELRNTHTMMKIAGEKNWYSILFVPM